MGFINMPPGPIGPIEKAKRKATKKKKAKVQSDAPDADVPEHVPSTSGEGGSFVTGPHGRVRISDVPAKDAGPVEDE